MKTTKQALIQELHTRDTLRATNIFAITQGEFQVLARLIARTERRIVQYTRMLCRI